MNLERMTVEYHAVEDRMLLRVFFDGTSEIRFWLTRRLVGRIWPVLIQLAQAAPDIQMQSNPEARKALLGFQHEKALQQVKISNEPQEPAREQPLGAEPMLISQMHARRNERQQTVLSFLPHKGNGIDLALGDTLLHGLLKLIQDSASKAQWDMTLAVPALDMPAAEPDIRRTFN